MNLIAPLARDVVDPASSQKALDFELIRSRRKTLSMEVRAGKLIVRSPLYLNEKYILKFIEEKSSWVRNKIKQTTITDRVRQDHAKYLGEEYKIVSGDVIKWHLDRGKMQLMLAGLNRKNTLLLRDFYKTQTKKLIEGILPEFSDDFEFNTGKIKYRFYKSRWGGCSGKNILSFNCYLSRMPLEVIRYVVVHELCHIQEKNHQKIFWKNVKNYDENYKEHRKYLRSKCINHL